MPQKHGVKARTVPETPLQKLSFHGTMETRSTPTIPLFVLYLFVLAVPQVTRRESHGGLARVLYRIRGKESYWHAKSTLVGCSKTRLMGGCDGAVLRGLHLCGMGMPYDGTPTSQAL
ncbi:MAG: hypothetical protein ACKO37_06105 [Vampirovibrionales bacterium]